MWNNMPIDDIVELFPFLCCGKKIAGCKPDMPGWTVGTSVNIFLMKILQKPSNFCYIGEWLTHNSNNQGETSILFLKSYIIFEY